MSHRVWAKVLQLLVVNRLIDPGSEFRVHRRWFDQSAMGIYWRPTLRWPKKIDCIAVWIAFWSTRHARSFAENRACQASRQGRSVLRPLRLEGATDRPGFLVCSLDSEDCAS